MHVQCTGLQALTPAWVHRDHQALSDDDAEAASVAMSICSALLHAHMWQHMPWCEAEIPQALISLHA